MRAAQVGSKGKSSEAAEPQPEEAKPERADPWQGQWLPCNPEALPSEGESTPLLSERAADAWFAGQAFAGSAGMEPAAATPVSASETPAVRALAFLAAAFPVFPTRVPAWGTGRVTRLGEKNLRLPHWRPSAR